LDERVERVKVFAFIDSQKTEFELKTLCEVCEVPRSSYYDWVAAVAAGPDEAVWDEAILANRIYDVWVRSRRRYGAPRVTAALWRAGVRVNHKRVERLMAEMGIAGRCGRRKLRTTWRDPAAELAPDLVRRNFHPGAADRLWVGDLTYVATGEGWLYVSSVLDAHTRRLIGWSITDHMRAEACCDALRAAAATRGRVRLDGVIFHSDHGSQGGFKRPSQHLERGGVRWRLCGSGSVRSSCIGVRSRRRGRRRWLGVRTGFGSGWQSREGRRPKLPRWRPGYHPPSRIGGSVTLAA
jgi:transposase InsO family protein